MQKQQHSIPVRQDRWPTELVTENVDGTSVQLTVAIPSGQFSVLPIYEREGATYSLCEIEADLAAATLTSPPEAFLGWSDRDGMTWGVFEFLFKLSKSEKVEDTITSHYVCDKDEFRKILHRTEVVYIIRSIDFTDSRLTAGIVCCRGTLTCRIDITTEPESTTSPGSGTTAFTGDTSMVCTESIQDTSNTDEYMDMHIM